MKYCVKICLIGDQAVGKTALCDRFINRSFKNEYKRTLGVETYKKTIDLDEYTVEVNLWDFSGQTIFSRIRPAFYHEAMGSLVVFDIACLSSFVNIPNWLKEADENTKSMEMILISNKMDLEKSRVVSEESSKSFTKSQAIELFPTSAKTGEGVDEAFFHLIRRIIKKGKAYEA
ncbi:MAG: Rab family GTPase [Promethearchaeota archaeon]